MWSLTNMLTQYGRLLGRCRLQKMLQNSRNNSVFGDALHNAINVCLIIGSGHFLASFFQKRYDAFLCLNCLKLGVNLNHTSSTT